MDKVCLFCRHRVWINGFCYQVAHYMADDDSCDNWDEVEEYRSKEDRLHDFV